MGRLSFFRKNKVQSEDDCDGGRRGLSLLPTLSITQWWKRSSTDLERVAKLRPERSMKSILDEIRTEEELIKFSQQKPTLRIDPDGRFKTHWDMFMLLLVYYVSIATPMRLAFFSDNQCNELVPALDQVSLSRDCQSEEIDLSVSSAEYFIFLKCPPLLFTAVDIVVDVIFWLDLIMAFFTGYKPNRSLTTEYSLKKIRIKYLRSWFFIDLFAVLPIDRIVNSLTSEYSVQLEVVRLTRLLRLSRLLKRMGEIMASKSFRIVYLLILYTTIAHWIGCAFFFSGRWQVENLKSGGANEFTGEPWLIDQCLQFANFRTQYCMSLYWAFTTMTTVGYGDILPTTNIDRNITCLVMVMSAVIQAIIFGNVAVLIQIMDEARKKLQTRLDAVWELLSFHNIPEATRLKAMDAIEYSWNFSQGVDDDSLLDSFPEGVRTDLLLHTRPHVLPFFEDLGSGFQRAILPFFKLRTYVPEDYVIHAGDTGSEMYIVRDGVCEVLTEDEQTTLAFLKSGDFFGDIDMILRSRRMATVKAKSHCILYVLERETLESVLDRFQGLRDRVVEKTKRRRDLLNSRNSSVTDKKKSSFRPHAASTSTDSNGFALATFQESNPGASSLHKEQQCKSDELLEIKYLVELSNSILERMQETNPEDKEAEQEERRPYAFTFPVFSPATTDE